MSSPVANIIDRLKADGTVPLSLVEGAAELASLGTGRPLAMPAAYVFVSEEAAAENERMEAAAFRQGDVVRATSRQGLPLDMMIGDVGVVLLCDPAAGPHTTVLCAHRSGVLVRAEVQTASLVKVEG